MTTRQARQVDTHAREVSRLAQELALRAIEYQLAPDLASVIRSEVKTTVAQIEGHLAILKKACGS